MIPASAVQEKALIDALRSGKNAAKRSLYEQFHRYLAAVCARYVPDDETVKDLLQYIIGRQTAECMQSVNSPVWSQPIETIKPIVVIVPVEGDANRRRQIEILRKGNAVAYASVKAVALRRAVIKLVALVDSTRIIKGVVVLREGVGIPVATDIATEI